MLESLALSASKHLGLLPSAQTPPPVLSFETSANPRTFHSAEDATILFVEDEDLLRESVAKLLRKKGFTVLEAADGSAALETLRTSVSPIDVLFLDITLPGTSSQQVLGETRRLAPELPIIVTSAYSREQASETLQADFDHFLRKPYHFADLLSLVGKALSLSGSSPNPAAGR
jgi:CheY-like chemotaxis protein